MELQPSGKREKGLPEVAVLDFHVAWLPNPAQKS